MEEHCLLMVQLEQNSKMADVTPMHDHKGIVGLFVLPQNYSSYAMFKVGTPD